VTLTLCRPACTVRIGVSQTFEPIACFSVV
jgi:hypothetical protein